MKILKINPTVSNVKKHEVMPIKPQICTVSHSIPYSSAYLGRDLVSFGNKPFHETLKENYFQLPPDCFPDEFQLEAGKALNKGNSVLVEAPTGTGKTAIAHYVASKNIEKGKTTFYTTPLKALSNQKLNEFRAIYGDENVGILTGDRRENAEAPIVIMTTEVYRNMALANAYGQKNPLMENLGTVIFDEFHYLGDSSRGSVWEESLIYTPKDVQTLELSATIGNPEQLKNWINSLDNNEVSLISIPSEARHVPLKFSTLDTKAYLKSEKWLQKQLEKAGTINYDELKVHSPKPDLSDYKSAVQKLSDKEQLPAIFFVFSRKYSRELLDYLGKEEKSLTTETEKAQIKEILNRYKEEKYIGSDLNENALLNGYAIHNAGIIPNQKELIEELFQKKLIKVVIATETLAAGINMPAKTVVISSPYKPSDSEESEDKTRMLSANEFKQMAGRAGRRGIDTQGYVYTMPTDRFSDMDFLELERRDCNSLESQYNPDYSFLCSFYEYDGNHNNLKNVFEKSFYSYSDDKEQSDLNVKKLMQDSILRTELLKQKGFLEENGGVYSLTNKGIMASKVKGYNAIPLVEMITSGKMTDITPETLALIAGAIANPVKNDEGELTTIGMELDELTANISNSVDNVHSSLEKSVSEKLKMLGKSINSFASYNDILSYVKKLERPNADIYEIKNKLQDLSEKRSKAYVITKSTGTMLPDELAEAVRNGDTIPTKVLENNLQTVESYKKRLNVKDIDEYIYKLENELNELSSVSKGKKAQARLDRRKYEIISELQIAKNRKFLDDNLYNEINNNYMFLKKNPLEKIKDDLIKTQKEYVTLVSKDSLIDELQGLIDIEEFSDNHDLLKIEKINKGQAISCIKELVDSSLLLKGQEKKSGLPVNSDRPGKIGAKAAYNWTMMNSINDTGLTNWQELISVIPSKTMDEGSLYRSIVQTADLLSQISEMAEAAMQNAENESDWEYYNHLKHTAQQARELMIQKPIEI